VSFNFHYNTIIVPFSNFVFLEIVCSCVCYFLFQIAAYSSGGSSKPQSPHRAYIFNELKEAKRALALKDEAMKKLEEKLQKVGLKQDRSSASIHGSHHSHRHSSRGSSNAHDHEEEH